ncbi:MAG: cysteine synthase family protein [bacterium]
MEKLKNILDYIGNTPIISLNKKTTKIDNNILVKLEFLNPSGSIKDRIALQMIEDAEAKGLLKPGYTVIEASTGNTAIALSFVGAMKGYKVKIFMPKEVGEQEKLKIIKLYGAEVETIETGYSYEAKDGSVHGGQIEIIPRSKCLELERKDNTVWWARQFSNPMNAYAHQKTTGEEIIKQTNGDVDAFVASAGTAGTILGVGRALKKMNKNIKIVGVEPAGSVILRKGKSSIKIIEGITGGLLLEALDVVDEVLVIENDEAVNMANNLAREEGLFCGISGGANVLASIQIAKKYPQLNNIVTVLPDRRDRYFTKERYTT